MLDLKTLNSAFEQLESERNIPRERVIGAVEDALAAAYKKDYGKRGQIVRATFDPKTGKADFHQVKVVVDETMVRMPEEFEEEDEADSASKTGQTRREEEGTGEKTKKGSKKEASESENTSDEALADEEKRPRFNPEHHILLEDAKKIKKDASIEEEIIFPLEAKDDYGRIASQTAKQVIIQRIREAERISVTEEFEKRKGDLVSGTIQRIERGNVYVDIGRIVGVIPYEEQIPGERFRIGDRIQAYLLAVEETARDINLRLSRSHPKFLFKLFEREVPEVASGIVSVKGIAREPGLRSKVAVATNDIHIDPVGSCVGQRGVRVSTVMSEAGGEKIDIVEWSDDPEKFIARALSPAEVGSVHLSEGRGEAVIEVEPEQYSLAIGKGGQNARLAAKLTGWRIDIRETTGEQEFKTTGEGETKEEEAGETTKAEEAEKDSDAADKEPTEQKNNSK